MHAVGMQPYLKFICIFVNHRFYHQIVAMVARNYRRYRQKSISLTLLGLRPRRSDFDESELVGFSTQSCPRACHFRYYPDGSLEPLVTLS